MTTQAPARSYEQPMAALRRANEVRTKRSKLKKDLKSGVASIEGILSNPPDYALTMKVVDVLIALPKFGRVKAARVLKKHYISETKTVGGLSERQREALLDFFVQG